MNTTSTISWQEVAAAEWDVIVLGAGVAGAIAAYSIAGQGPRVLLVDQHQFPRRKVCGACLNRSALELLFHVGLRPQIDDLKGNSLHCFSLRCGKRELRVELPPGRAISRESLDAALVDAAVARGVKFLPATKATVGEFLEGRRQVRLEWQGSCDAPLVAPMERLVGLPHAQMIAAPVVIVATGLGATCLPRSQEWTTRVSNASRIGAGCTVQDESSDFGDGTIWMCVAPGGYLGLVRLEDGRLNIAAALAPSCVRRSGSLTHAAIHILTNAAVPVPGALQEAKWQGTLALTRQVTPVASRGVFLIGDAAGYVEPFTGQGMYWALETGNLVAPWVVQALSGWNQRIAQGWGVAYRQIYHQQKACRNLSRALSFPTLFSLGMMAVARFPRLLDWLLPELVGDRRSITTLRTSGLRPMTPTNA